jgi:hypothetical protein
VEADSVEVELAAREVSGSLYLIAVRRSPQLTTEVTFSGLPAGISSGEVLFE